MKFICNSAKLQKAIGIVEKAISSRTSLPILENIFFELNEGRLKLRANDLEIGIENVTTVDQSQADGKILLKAKTISNIVSKFQNLPISFQVDSNNKVIINVENRVDFDIMGTHPDDYPVFPSVEEGIRIKLTVAEIKELIRTTIFSVSFDETKPFLNGILIKNDQDKLLFVSTDGYRLSLRSSSVVRPVSDFSVIVPYKALNEILKIFQHVDSSQSVDLNISPNQISVIMNDFLFISRVIQGQFPDFKQVIPQSSANKYSLSRREFLEALERASIISSASNNVVRFVFDESGLVIQANAPGLGEFKEAVKINRIQGSGTTKVAFNVRLVLDAVKILDSDELNIEFNSEESPCVMRPNGVEDYTYIIMPIRTNDYQEESSAR